MPFTPSPWGGHGDHTRRISPLIVIPLVAIVLIVGALAVYVKSQAAPASRLVQLTRSQLPSGTPTSPTWYFDGGSVGGGFQEYLTMQNPDPSVASNVMVTYFLQANPPTNPTHVRKVTHTIPAATRQTFDVNADLGTTTTGPHIDAAALVQVTSGPGIIVERPWYFNNLGVNSGTDTFGVTTPQKAYYFAEADSTNAPKVGQPDYNTFVSVLDPSPTLNANATITYYTGVCGASGQAACPTQQVSLIPYQRLVFKPTIGLGYHNHFSISVVSSDNPIIAERLLYVKDNLANIGGWTTGAIMNVGATAPGTDWLFAEGYTGSGFQEYYKLANFGTSATNAHIKLEYTNGDTQTVTVPVPALGFVQFDVNYAYAHPGTCVPAPCQLTSSVSAEITSDAPIVAERLMYFHFGPTRISGTTDVVGTPAAQSTYAFAEGYTNRPFAEFITLQNPTGNTETALVTFYTPTHAYQEQVTVVAHSRLTIDVDVDLAKQGASGAVSTLVQVQGAGAVMVAERPQYFVFNLGGNLGGGGTDVIGYTGS
jgi:hypothetical protein